MRLHPTAVAVKFWPRRVGKRRYTQLLVDRALNEGEHVHSVGVRREWCEGGYSECPVWARQLGKVRDEDRS